MDEAKRNEIRQWLIKGRRDLGSARRLMEGSEPFFDTAVYHCQQAAEKTMKGYLTFKDIPFEKTHNLVALLALCGSFEPGFGRWEEAAEMLTPYATEFRYPGDVLEPESDEAEKAFAAAEAFVNFIIHLLPDEVKPPA